MKILATRLALLLLLLAPPACDRGGGGGEAAAPAEEIPLEQILQLRDEAQAWFAAENARIDPLLEADPARYGEEMERVTGELQERLRPYGERLGRFLEKHPDDAGARQAYASHLASFVAPRLINEEGNYREAAVAYQEALALEPGNAEIEAALQEARELSFITLERFSEVEPGMGFDQVREICGIPRPALIRQEERGGKALTGWYYPTEDWSAAGFFFADGEVYAKEFEAIPAEAVRRLAAARPAGTPSDTPDEGGEAQPAVGFPEAGAPAVESGAVTPASEAAPSVESGTGPLAKEAAPGPVADRQGEPPPIPQGGPQGEPPPIPNGGRQGEETPPAKAP